MNENIINVISNKRIVCDQFDMSSDEFYRLMFDNIKRDYELYHLEYDGDNKSIFVIYKGKKYQLTYDGKNLEEVLDQSELNDLFHLAWESISWVCPRGYIKDDSEINKLLELSYKKEQIVRFNKWIEEWEEQKKFFNKNKSFGLNDLNFSEREYEKINKANVGLTVFLMFCNMCGFFIPFIREFYMSIGSYFLLTYIPLLAKYIADLKALNKGKKRTFIYYVLYPVLYLFSRKNCNDNIKDTKKRLEYWNKDIESYYEACINELSNEKQEEITEEKDVDLEERLTIEKIENNTKEEEKTEEKVNVLKKSLKR